MQIELTEGHEEASGRELNLVRECVSKVRLDDAESPRGVQFGHERKGKFMRQVTRELHMNVFELEGVLIFLEDKPSQDFMVVKHGAHISHGHDARNGPGPVHRPFGFPVVVLFLSRRRS